MRFGSSYLPPDGAVPSESRLAEYAVAGDSAQADRTWTPLGGAARKRPHSVLDETIDVSESGVAPSITVLQVMECICQRDDSISVF